MRKIPEEVITQVLKKYEDGRETPVNLARKYNVSKHSVYRWINSRTERDVQSVTHLSQREFHKMQLELKRLRIDNQAYASCRCNWNSPLHEKLEEIQRLKEQFSIHALCRILQVSRATYYNYALRRPEKTSYEIADDNLRPLIKKIFEDSKERFGSRKIKVVLGQQNIFVSFQRISRLMKEMELVCKQERLRYWSTTSRKYKYYAKKLRLEKAQPAPNMVWVSDITYIRMKDKFCYVCIVIDLFARRVLSHHVSDTMDSRLVQRTFDEAYKARNSPQGLVFHSDLGAQYISFNFRKHLDRLGVTRSYSHPGTPLDNAFAESFFSCMKREELSHKLYSTIEELKADVSEYVSFYNEFRVHERLGNRTPLQVEEEYFSRQ